MNRVSILIKNQERYSNRSEERKQKMRDSVKKYYKKNKYKLNKYQINRSKEMIKLSKELGNCTSCHKPKASDKYLRCAKCRNYVRKSYKKKEKNENLLET